MAELKYTYALDETKTRLVHKMTQDKVKNIFVQIQSVTSASLLKMVDIRENISHMLKMEINVLTITIYIH